MIDQWIRTSFVLWLCNVNGIIIANSNKWSLVSTMWICNYSKNLTHVGYDWCFIALWLNTTYVWASLHLSQFPPFRYFPNFSTMPKTHVDYWISGLYLAGVAAAHFPDDIFECIFLIEDVKISIKISLKFVPKGPISNIPALVQKMAWRRPGQKPLSETMMVNLLTHICMVQVSPPDTLYIFLIYILLFYSRYCFTIAYIWTYIYTCFPLFMMYINVCKLTFPYVNSTHFRNYISRFLNDINSRLSICKSGEVIMKSTRN